MGSGASVEDASTVFSYKDFPKQLYVEGAGSPIANGKFVLRTDKDALPLTKIKNSSSSASKMIQKSPSFRKGGVWFSKDDGTDCWMAFIDGHKKGKCSEVRIILGKSPWGRRSGEMGCLHGSRNPLPVLSTHC